MSHRPVWACVAAAGLLAASAGCNDSSGLITVTGQVTLDGQPLADGRINFVPDKAPPTGGAVMNGQYTIAVLPGSYKVQVYAEGERRRVEGGTRMYSVPLIPRRYNEATTLAATVCSSDRRFDFQLERKDERVNRLPDEPPRRAAPER